MITALTTSENAVGLAVVAAYLCLLVAAFRRAARKLNENEHDKQH